MACTCQDCNKPYRVDVMIPDVLWNAIRPADKEEGAGLLCGRCIFDRIEARGEYAAFHLREG